MAEANANPDLDGAMSPELALEMESLKTTERAALLMVLLGEQQASEIVGYLNPREVQALGTAMVGVSGLLPTAAIRSVPSPLTNRSRRCCNVNWDGKPLRLSRSINSSRPLDRNVLQPGC